MDALLDLKDMLCEQVEDIVKKGDITPAELDHLDKAVDIIKDVTTIEAMERSEDYNDDHKERSWGEGRRINRHSEKETLMQELNNLQRRIDQMK